jgi:hypothetical protein
MKYKIDIHESFEEGGSAEFYSIKHSSTLGFKQFKNKNWAIDAYTKQKLLSKLGLAPKVYGEICRLTFDDPLLKDHITGWGFITERAKTVDEKSMRKRLSEIQNLVNIIHDKTGLKFWDCHYYNIGYVTRNKKSKLVCIDTGKESFDRECNAWGFSEPGPKCNYCKKYQCKCSIY